MIKALKARLLPNETSSLNIPVYGTRHLALIDVDSTALHAADFKAREQKPGESAASPNVRNATDFTALIDSLCIEFE